MARNWLDEKKKATKMSHFSGVAVQFATSPLRFGTGYV